MEEVVSLNAKTSATAEQAVKEIILLWKASGCQSYRFV